MVAGSIAHLVIRLQHCQECGDQPNDRLSDILATRSVLQVRCEFRYCNECQCRGSEQHHCAAPYDALPTSALRSNQTSLATLPSTTECVDIRLESGPFNSRHNDADTVSLT